VSETLPSLTTELLIPLRKPKTEELFIPIRPERRRTPRQHAPIPLFVYGYGPEEHAFHEGTATIAVNVHGGSMRMNTAVQLGQRLLVTNRENERSQPCIVVFVGERLDGGFDVAFSFTAEMIHFWEKPGPGKNVGAIADKAASNNEIEVHCRAVELAKQ
jgi:hypothetical protein